MKAAAILGALLLLGLSAAQAAKIYKWTDPQGKVIYSDRPRPGAVEIEVPTEPAGIVPVPPRDAAQPGQPASRPAAYRTLKVVSPADQQVLENIGGLVNVSLSVDPSLQVAEGHAIRLRLDGRTLDTRYPGAEIALSNVERGEHTLAAEVVDRAGAVLIVSAAVAFTLHEPSSQTPAGPDIYPPATPAQPYPPVYDPAYPQQPQQGRPKPTNPYRQQQQPR
ncbi:MAG TPA: DUF4124 domain-containing protein [Burkholderiales bacterium]|jgi:hypothetical protein